MWRCIYDKKKLHSLRSRIREAVWAESVPTEIKEPAHK